MAVINYADKFVQILAQKYATELKSNELFNSNPGIVFMNAQTIKLPRLTLSGYKDHTRTIGFNTGTLSNDWEPKKLEHDRDIEFFVDPMDIDETNQILSVANIQNTFEEEQAIPEQDSYAFSKLGSELVTYSGSKTTDVLTKANILEAFDTEMQKMDDAGVPEEGRIMYVTAAVNKLLKEADGFSRSISISAGPNAVNRKVHSLDDVTIKPVPSARLKSAYDFTDGCVASATAKQINFILVHPSCVVARKKYSYIHLFTPGTDSRTGDGYLYQNRSFLDLFMLEKKVAGCAMNIDA